MRWFCNHTSQQILCFSAVYVPHRIFNTLSWHVDRIHFFSAVAVYCKDSLCRKETFVQLAELLTKDDAPLTEKRVSVYLLSVLVANNSKIEIKNFYIKSAICAHRFFSIILCITVYVVLY